MITIKAYSDLEQSKKLAEILPFDSADMYWDYDVQEHEYYPMVMDEQFDDTCIRAWSLAALLGVLNSIDGWYPGIDSKVNGNMWQVCMFSYETGSDINTAAINEELVDTCYEVILKLHECKML